VRDQYRNVYFAITQTQVDVKKKKNETKAHFSEPIIIGTSEKYVKQDARNTPLLKSCWTTINYQVPLAT
jgi:hypothetical protein